MHQNSRFNAYRNKHNQHQSTFIKTEVPPPCMNKNKRTSAQCHLSPYGKHNEPPHQMQTHA
jgi:hypothetical protein